MVLHRRYLHLYVEFSALMLAMPLALLHFGLQKFLLPGLWAVAIYCLWMRRRYDGATFRDAWQREAVNAATLRPMLARFAACAMGMAIVTLIFVPDNFLGFVRQMPFLWLIVMVLYPLLSVVAQEIIYRWFFFHRYAAIFPTDRAMVLASALAFGFGHIVFNNWIAPVLCVIGGLIFAGTYLRRPSLALVCLEHALYGDFLFTIGLGWYFYHGNVH